jgi:hypothetical protein
VPNVEWCRIQNLGLWPTQALQKQHDKPLYDDKQQQQASQTGLEQELAAVTARCTTLGIEKQQQQASQTGLEQELAAVTARCTTLGIEKQQQQASQTGLEQELAEGTARCATLGIERQQQQASQTGLEQELADLVDRNRRGESEIRAMQKRVDDLANRAVELREDSTTIATDNVWLDAALEQEMHVRAVALNSVTLQEQQETVVARLTAQVVRLTNLYNEAVLPPYETQRAALLSTQHDAASERTHFVNMVK